VHLVYFTPVRPFIPDRRGKFMKEKTVSKIGIIGAGFVGSTFAYSLVVKGLVNEIVLVDTKKEKAEGEALDIAQSVSYNVPTTITAGEYSDLQDAEIVVITAGASQKKGETRLDLTKKNAQIIKTIVENLKQYNRDCIILMTTNPVDVLTYAAQVYSGFPKNRIIGTGTTLDTSRLRYEIGLHCGVDPRNVHGYILGEHGDSEVPIWSGLKIGGMELMAFCQKCEKVCEPKKEMNQIFKKVKNSAYEIIEKKSATYYAIAYGLTTIVQAVTRDQDSILPVSVYIDDFYGIKNFCFSLPALINRGGIKRILNIPLSEGEVGDLKHSAGILKSYIEDFV
jgi:L-lactate dehydrogenase